MPEKLPKGWVKTTLSEVCAVNPRMPIETLPPDHTEVSFVPMAAVEEESGRLDASQIRPLAAVRRGYTPFKESDVIFAKITPCMENGKIALATGLKNGLAYGSTEFFVLRSYEGLLPRFLLYFLLQPSLREDAKRQMTGAVGQKRVPSNYLFTYEFLLPPTREQERIVAKLDAALLRLERAEIAARRAQERLKRYRTAVLRAAVTGELTHEWRAAQLKNKKEKPETGEALLQRLLTARRARWEEAELKRFSAAGKEPKNDKWKSHYPEPVEPRVDDPPELPGSWCWASVDQLAAHEERSITDGPFGSNLKTSHYTDSGPRVVRIQNVGDAVFIDQKAHISRKHYESLRHHAVYAGDLVIRALGMPAPRACKIPELLGPAIVKADCIRFKVASEFISPDYVLWALNSPPVQARTGKMIHGVGRPRLNLSEIKSIALPLPPLAEQAEIAREVERHLSAADRLAASLEQQIARARSTRQSLLHEAFSGRLVPQNPNDEPASVLLEHIRAAREAEAQKQKGKRMKTMKKPKSKWKKARRALLDVLREHKGPMVPEQLFREAGFEASQVDLFYRELTSLRDKLLEQKPKGSEAKLWPHRANVLLQLKKGAEK